MRHKYHNPMHEESLGDEGSFEAPESPYSKSSVSDKNNVKEVKGARDVPINSSVLGIRGLQLHASYQPLEMN